MVPPNGPRLGALDVDVDPLVVVGRVGELVDPLLVDLTQSLVPISSPAAAATSSRVVKTRMSASIGWLLGWLDDGMTAAATEPTVPTRDQVLRAPKVLLHDHLDGGLRPATIAGAGRARSATSCRRTTPSRWGAGSPSPPTPARWSATSRPSTTPSR